MKRAAAAVLGAAMMLAPLVAKASGPVRIVAAENVYGDIAKQIGGPDVTVTSILSNPDQDPHLFEASPAVARNLTNAQIVIENGLDYDPWMNTMLKATPAAGRRTIDVGALVARKPGDNPHIWYDTQAVLAAAAVLAETLAARDPAHAAGYHQRLAAFQHSMHPIEEKIDALRARLAGTPVTATEPILGYVFDALGMKTMNEAFQLAVMNDTEPGAADVAAMQNDLKSHGVAMLVYNSQATDPAADRMKQIAETAGVPVVGATETEPAGLTYQAWVEQTLDAIDKALPARS